MKKTHFKKLRNPNFIGSYELMNGDTSTELIVEITDVKNEQVNNGDKIESLMVMYLKDQKPMIVNATNSKNIVSALKSPYIEDWIGKKIILYVENIKAFGGWHDALRVRKTPPQKPNLAPDKIDGVIDAIKKGATMKQVENKYKLTPEQKTKIENEIKK